MIIKRPSSLTETQLQKVFTVLSAMITIQVIYIQHGWINDDSVLYFEAARLFSMGEWKQGVKLFNWPFYPILISAVNQVTQLSIQTSAQLLNTIFFSITTYSFISLIRLAGGNKTAIICGAFLLLNSRYIVGDVLPMLLRDQGFWAMFLTSLAYFIKFYRNLKLSDALLWQSYAILAVLFRIEAITFLALLPLILLQQSQYSAKQKMTLMLKVNLIPITIFVLISCVLIFSPTTHLHNFGRLHEVVSIPSSMLTEIAHKFSAKANIMGEQVLGSFFYEFGLITVLVSLASILVIKIISLIGWPVIGLFALNRANNERVTMQDDAHSIFRWTIALATLNAGTIIASAFVLSSRYIIAIGFILLIIAAFHLATLLKKLHSINRARKLVVLILLIFTTYSGIRNILPKQTGYTYEQDAIAYIKQQATDKKVFYVTPRSRYFAGAPYAGRGYDYWDYTQKAISDTSIYQYDYLVINLDIDDQFAVKEKILAEELPQYTIAKEFYGYRKKKKIMIYVKNSLTLHPIQPVN